MRFRFIERSKNIIIMASDATNDAGALVRELREISDRHSSWRNRQGTEEVNGARAVEPSSSEEESQANVFLSRTNENRDLNQYWYSKNTIETLCNAMREGLKISKGRRVAFLSTPSLYFSLSPEEKEHCAVLDVSLIYSRESAPRSLLHHLLISSICAVWYFVGVLLGISLLWLQLSNQNRRQPPWYIRLGRCRSSIHLSVSVGKICNHCKIAAERQQLTHYCYHCQWECELDGVSLRL